MSVFRNMLMEITSQPPTPSYTELRCLTSTGTQFINTLIEPTNQHEVIIDFQYTEDVASVGTRLFGSRQSWSSNGFYVGTSQNIIGRRYWVQVSSYGYTTNVDSDYNRHIMDFNKNVGGQRYAYLDGNNLSALTSREFTSYGPIYLFGALDGDYTQSQTHEAPGAYKLYSCKIYDNETLVRDYIPVLDSNNVACLYDKVSNQFFYNAGTGTFSYELDTYTITFNANGGWTEYQPVTVNAGQSIDLSQYTIGEGDPGAEFGGWTSTKNDDATLLPSTFTPTEDMTIYAYWQPELSPISYNSQANALGFKNIANLSSALSSSYIEHLYESGGDSFEIQHNGEQVGGIDIYHDEVVYVDIYLNTTGVDGKIDTLSFNYVSNADFTKFTGTGSYLDDELNEYTLNMCFNEVDSFDSNYEPLYLNLYNSDTQSEYFTDAMNLVSQLVYYRYDGE